MTEERWRRIEEICHDALERSVSERTAFVREACAGDAALHDEVESLLANQSRADSLASGLGLRDVGLDLIGKQIGVYQIVSLLGAGGMGDVYRARDTKLQRDVALKALPPAFIAEPERRARFEREARVLASLNDPHIGAIYGFEEWNGAPFLILELIEGETLADRIAGPPLSPAEAMKIARQIAEALDAAHEKGIVHRDLKPANIKISPDGNIKVLDFGLAKLTQRLDAAPTSQATLATRPGAIFGTPVYMSPEQARGLPVDKRADIWAFGCVLYELLTGARPFPGETTTDVLAAIVNREPDFTTLPVATPPGIKRLLARCLDKDPKRRLRDIGEARIAIEDPIAPPGDVTPVGRPQARRRRITWETIAALVAASLLAALGTWAVMRNEPPAPALPARFTITFPAAEPMELTDRGRDIALSPDGRYLAYQSRGRLMLRALDQLDAVLLSSVTAGRTPFFSPDSRWIGFFDGGDLKKVAVTGGPVITVCRELGTFQGGTWGDDGTIVVSSPDGNIGLRRVSADGGQATALTKTGAPQQRHLTPSMLPGGRGVLFTIWPNAPEDPQVAVIDLKSGQQKTVLRGGGAAEYLETGHLIYVTVGSQGSAESGTLWVVAFDLDRLAARGEPVRVSESLQVDLLSAANYAVSRTGALAYVPARAQARSFVWVDRTGRETPIDALPPRPYGTIGLSPDSTRMAFWSDDRESDIWVWDFARKSSTRLTFDPGLDALPRWMPDGRRIVFSSRRAGPLNLFSMASDGSGTVERLTTSNNDQFVNSIAPDGTALLFCERRPKTGFDILRLPLVAAPRGAGTAALSEERISEATPLVASRSEEFAASISPNGRYFAYQSTESGGRSEIYVRPYPDATQGRWQISTEGGKAPVWARSGRELFYLDGSNALMTVPVQTSGSQFRFDRPAKVFDAKYSGVFYSYDVTPDGLRFLMMKDSNPGDRSHLPSMVVVLNWFEELRGRVPAQ